ncbi:MAG: hypothetical protein GXP49_16355 [Deltaproteobacteria bacterium]|nr:hypothetical protein [Deltaproteobacteria bacterium]
MSEKERRIFPRIEVNAYVDYTGSEVLLFHKIENISLGGISIKASKVEPMGTVVDLFINFPDLDKSIHTKGEVVWASEESPLDMGIRYVNLTPADKEILKKYLIMSRKLPR